MQSKVSSEDTANAANPMQNIIGDAQQTTAVTQPQRMENQVQGIVNTSNIMQDVSGRMTPIGANFSIGQLPSALPGSNMFPSPHMQPGFPGPQLVYYQIPMQNAMQNPPMPVAIQGPRSQPPTPDAAGVAAMQGQHQMPTTYYPVQYVQMVPNPQAAGSFVTAPYPVQGVYPQMGMVPAWPNATQTQQQYQQHRSMNRMQTSRPGGGYNRGGGGYRGRGRGRGSAPVGNATTDNGSPRW